MAAPHLDIKTILTTNSGQAWAPVGGTSLRPDPPTVNPSVITSTTVTVTLSPGNGLTSRIPYLNGSPLTAISGSATSYPFTGLAASTPYSLSFVDEKNGRLSASSIALQVTTNPPPPIVAPDPPVITFVSKSATSITINSTGSPGATSYIPVRSGTALAEITQFPYPFTGLSGGTPYTLTVRAKNSTNVSGDSNPITQTTSAAVTTLTVPVKCMAYGGTDWTDQAEITRRAGFDLVVLQGWYGMSATTVATHINAIRAINPSVKILLYIMFEGIGDNDDLGAFLQTNNLWARDVFPGGTRQSIWQGTHGANLAGTRLVGGLTCGENLAALHATKNAAVWNLVDGLMFDNMWYAAGYGYDYNEDGSADSATSVGMCNGHIVAYQKIVAFIKRIYPRFEFWCNPRAPAEKIKGIDNKAGFVAQKWDGYMNQNAGPGMWFNGEGVFPYDGLPASLTNYRLYPSEATFTGTPAHGTFLRNGFGNFLAHSQLPNANPTLLDIASELQAGNWVANVQNVLQECKGFSETEEITYGPLASQHNRICLGYWWVLTDCVPYLYGIDGGTGRTILTTYQQYFKGHAWIDPAQYLTPYVTVGGHPTYMRRADNGAMIVNPRYENGAASSAPAFVTVPTPPLPPGKSFYTTWTGGAVGGTVQISHRDTLFLKAF